MCVVRVQLVLSESTLIGHEHLRYEAHHHQCCKKDIVVLCLVVSEDTHHDWVCNNVTVPLLGVLRPGPPLVSTNMRLCDES